MDERSSLGENLSMNELCFANVRGRHARHQDSVSCVDRIAEPQPEVPECTMFTKVKGLVLKGVVN